MGLPLRVLRAAPLVLALGEGTARAESFDPGCDLPFASISKKHPLDDQCPAQGDAGSDAHGEQNRAKNTFCASPPAARITVYSLKRLQAIAAQNNISFGGPNSLPLDRSVLVDLYKTSDGKRIGEGDQVVIAAYVLEAHVANTSNGESVNCKHKGVEWNDIHVALGETPDAGLCESVTAEVSPHFRPATWTASAIDSHHGYPFRITGHLFFDASHSPCKNGKGSPRRVSIWEIHPVYAIDVCVNKSLASCRVDDDSKWQPLNEAFEFENEE